MFQMLTIGLGVEQKGPRISFFFSSLLFFSILFNSFLFLKKLEVGGVYRHEQLSLTQQAVTNSKSTENIQKFAVK